jgi:hypothetical protein
MAGRFEGKHHGAGKVIRPGVKACFQNPIVEENRSFQVRAVRAGLTTG